MKEPFSIIHLRKDVIFPAQKIVSIESYFLKVWVFQLSLLDNTPNWWLTWVVPLRYTVWARVLGMADVTWKLNWEFS